MLKGVTLTVNYPDDEADAAIPSEMTVDQLGAYLKKLLAEEPEATSFVLVASIARRA